MSSLATILAWIITGAAIVPLATLSLEILFGLRPERVRQLVGPVPTTCVLVPAHNEDKIIKLTLDRLRDALPASASILIVADNCTDNTAEIAKKSGCMVLERHDGVNRGKGFALAYGRDWLSDAPPDCVIVFDADCATDSQSLSDLAKLSVSTRSVVQAGYFFEPSFKMPSNVQISNFALWVKNTVRQRGAHRLGGSAILTGTGMAFPWDVFAELPLNTASIVEDLALTLELVSAGKAPAYLDQAVITSVAASESATLKQRSRWEHGFLTVANKHGWQFITMGLRRRDRQMLMLGLHLFVPPLALLMGISFAINALLLPIAIATGHWWHLFALSSMNGILSVSVLLAWHCGGREWLSLKSLLLLPAYLVWKIPLYFRFLLGQTVTWVRTDRNTDV